MTTHGQTGAADLQRMLVCGFDFVVTPLVDPQHRPDLTNASTQALHRRNVMLMASQWSGQVSKLHLSRPCMSAIITLAMLLAHAISSQLPNFTAHHS